MLFVLSVASKAEIYKWVDEKGRTHYGDSNMRPSGKSVEKLNLKINTYTNVSFENTGFFSEKVIMYSAEWCGFCKKARKHFSANRIPFVEYDIDRDQRAKRRYQKLGAKGVPVILYKGRRMNGFSEAGFKRLYAQDT
jgi:glutaredoxin